ncbi:MAG TPA: hypothetical protein VF530_15740 [Planctomycetota bacterium]
MKTALRFRSILGLGLLLLLAPGIGAQVTASAYSHGSTSHGKGSAGYYPAGRSYSHGGRSYATSRVWVPGAYEVVHQRVWVPGWSEKVWIEPAFEWRFGSCGTRFRVQVGSGHWRTVHHPGRYETRPVRVWRAGHWVARGCD